MENGGKNSIREKVMAAITGGNVAMRPRWHFALRIALFITGGIVVLLALIYLTSFIIFGLRQTGIWFAPGFGARGWLEVGRELPWMLILFAIVFIIILEILVRRYAFAYRKPLLYSTLAIVGIVLLAGNLLSKGPFEERWLDEARRGHPPFPGGFYGERGFREPISIHRGEVEATTTTGFILEDMLGVTSTVILDQPLPPGFYLVPGESVVVMGPRIASATIRALDIRLIPD
jgi:hypothetical protein